VDGHLDFNYPFLPATLLASFSFIFARFYVPKYACPVPFSFLSFLLVIKLECGDGCILFLAIGREEVSKAWPQEGQSHLAVPDIIRPISSNGAASQNRIFLSNWITSR
jgi:hypothetical protein